MKKLTFLTVLLTFSIIGMAQSSHMEPVKRTAVDGQLPKYFVQEKYYRVPVRHLASDSILKFRLIDFTRTTERQHQTNEKQYLYELILMRLNDGHVLKLSSYDRKTLLSALNNDEHYIYTDGEKLFIAKKRKRDKF